MSISGIIVTVSLFYSARSGQLEPFISGGGYAKIDEFPHSLYLYIECKVPEVCGGSILNQNILITAAHCFENCHKSHEITAYGGSENLQKMQAAKRVTEFYIHQMYHSLRVQHDIALGYMKSAWPLDKNIKRVMIVRSYPRVQHAEVAGWGMTNDETMQVTNKLKFVKQNIQPTTYCSKAGKLYPGMMCAMNNKRNYPSSGDSGSALVANNGLQIGLVSWRSSYKKELVVYTNLTYYYNWIQRETSKIYCNK